MELQKLYLQLKAIFGKMSLSKRISFFSLLIVTITGFVFIIMWAGTPNYQSLYSRLNSEDAGLVLSYLKENKLPYKISEYGNTILIPKENIYEVRMALAIIGLPQGSGVGFEIFDNTKIGMSEFAQNINYQRALQGELSRTINRFDEIESSRVHIVMEDKSLFQDHEDPASASVVVKLFPGRKLSTNQVQSIIHLLSASVSGLEPNNVTVVDNNGNMLTSPKTQKGFEHSSEDHLEYQEKIEKNLENKVKSMLETALGPAKAIVRVSCLVDFKKQEKTEELYYPENRVIRSEQRFNEISGGQEMIPAGVPDVLKEKDLNETGNAVATKPNMKGYQKEDQTINYEIGKVTSHIVEPTGRIKRISVAIIVDGTYKEIEDEKGKASIQYVPRSEEEMQKLTNIVKRSVNFNDERGDEIEVVNIPFDTTTDTDGSKGEGEAKVNLLSKILSYTSVIKYVFAALFIFIMFLVIVRPIVSWITSTTINERELIDQLPKTVNEIENEMNANIKQISYQDRANKIMKNNQSSVELLRQWLTES